MTESQQQQQLLWGPADNPTSQSEPVKRTRRRKPRRPTWDALTERVRSKRLAMQQAARGKSDE